MVLGEHAGTAAGGVVWREEEEVTENGSDWRAAGCSRLSEL